MKKIFFEGIDNFIVRVTSNEEYKEYAAFEQPFPAFLITTEFYEIKVVPVFDQHFNKFSFAVFRDSSSIFGFEMYFNLFSTNPVLELGIEDDFVLIWQGDPA